MSAAKYIDVSRPNEPADAVRPWVWEIATGSGPDRSVLHRGYCKTYNSAVSNAVKQFAMLNACPNCQSGPGEACTQPTDTGRAAVSWVHMARESAGDHLQVHS